MKAKYKVGERVRSNHFWRPAPPVFEGLMQGVEGTIVSVEESRGYPARYKVAFDADRALPPRELWTDEDRIERVRTGNPGRGDGIVTYRGTMGVVRISPANVKRLEAAGITMHRLGYERGVIPTGRFGKMPLWSDKDVQGIIDRERLLRGEISEAEYRERSKNPTRKDRIPLYLQRKRK